MDAEISKWTLLGQEQDKLFFFSTFAAYLSRSCPLKGQFDFFIFVVYNDDLLPLILSMQNSQLKTDLFNSAFDQHFSFLHQFFILVHYSPLN